MITPLYYNWSVVGVRLVSKAENLPCAWIAIGYVHNVQPQFEHLLQS